MKKDVLGWEGDYERKGFFLFVLIRFFCNYKHIERDKEAVGNN